VLTSTEAGVGAGAGEAEVEWTGVEEKGAEDLMVPEP